MIRVRRAVVDDAPELVRLRGVMLAAMSGSQQGSESWQQAAVERLRKSLDDGPDGGVVAFVVDAPGKPGTLAACVVGVIERLLASPQNPTGDSGYVLSVATHPEHRKRGYSRACMEALLDWYEQRGITEVNLNTSESGERLYRSLGFVRSPEPAMRLMLPRDHATGSSSQ